MISLPFKTLYQSRDLLSAWTMRIIRARYQQSILGALWAVMQPIAMVAIFTAVFSVFIRVDTGNVPYAVFAYTAMVPWTLFNTAVTDMVDSITGNLQLVSKIFFPRVVLPIAALLARLLDFAIAYSVLIVLMLINGMRVFTAAWVFLPVVLLVQLALCLGVGMIGSALNVFYRDVRHLVVLVLQLWFYATPIIYPANLVPPQYQALYALNPMVGIIQAYRNILIEGVAPSSGLALSAGVAVVVLVVGYLLFKRLEAQFADII